MFRPVQFGKYQLTERIAVGGMAEIFKAEVRGARGFARQVVVKQILPQYANDPEFVRSFINEARTTVSLSHGNIVAAYELGRINQIYFIAMEYVAGKDLGHILEAARSANLPLSIEHAVFIAIEICKGLDYAHHRTGEDGALIGLIHRDISPGNILVSFSGQVKIADFGIAKTLRYGGSKTQTGAIKGTYGYMSPQQVAGEPIDQRADIFSTGVLLHEMLTGRYLFAGTNEYDTLQRAREATVVAPSSINPRVPQAVDEIVLKALAREPELRYYDAGDLQLDLARVLYANQGGATASSLARYLEQLFGADQQRANAASPNREASVGGALADPLAERKVEVPDSLGDGAGTQSYAVRRELDPPPATKTTPGQGAGLATAAKEANVAVQRTAPRTLDTMPATAEPSLSSADFDDGGTPTALCPANMADSSSSLDPPAAAGTDARKRELSDRHLEALSRPLPGGDIDDGILAGYGAPSRRHGPRSDESVMALLVRPPTNEHDTIDDAALSRLQLPAPAAAVATVTLAADRGADDPTAGGPPPTRPLPVQPEAAPEPAPSYTAEVRREGQKNTPTESRKALAATLRLFVQGLDRVQPIDDSAALDKIPRTIKPTILGWVVIVALFCCSIAFVVYRKTTLFRAEVTDNDMLLDLTDIREQPELAATPQLATIRLVTWPADAIVMLHEGETPLVISGLDAERNHLFRLERQGYRAKNEVVRPEQLGSSNPLTIVLDPVGAAAAAEYPEEVPSGPQTSQRSTLDLRSDPPSTTVWRIVGRGEVLLTELPVKRYYFKVVRAGYETSFVSVSVDQLRGGNGRIRESITLRPTMGSEGDVQAPPPPSQTGHSVGSSVSETRATDSNTEATAGPSAEATARATDQIKPSKRKRNGRHKARRKKSRRSRRRNRPALQVPSWAD